MIKGAPGGMAGVLDHMIGIQKNLSVDERKSFFGSETFDPASKAHVDILLKLALLDRSDLEEGAAKDLRTAVVRLKDNMNQKLIPIGHRGLDFSNDGDWDFLSQWAATAVALKDKDGLDATLAKIDAAFQAVVKNQDTINLLYGRIFSPQELLDAARDMSFANAKKAADGTVSLAGQGAIGPRALQLLRPCVQVKPTGGIRWLSI